MGMLIVHELVALRREAGGLLQCQRLAMLVHVLGFRVEHRAAHLLGLPRVGASVQGVALGLSASIRLDLPGVLPEGLAHLVRRVLLLRVKQLPLGGVAKTEAVARLLGQVLRLAVLRRLVLRLERQRLRGVLRHVETRIVYALVR